MKKCDYCKKIMTNDEEQTTIHSFHYTYAAEVDFDKVCDSCDAKGHAQGCIRAISADMQKFREISKKDKIVQPGAFLTDKLEKIRAYWIKHFTELVDDKQDGYWRTVFDGYVVIKTDYLADVVKKDQGKQDRINY